ncbi:MAG: hypothetical protein HY287_07355 [Planctomycetes bacterium]|nr:hypothetical protein [Planctomycetota bacterium]
MNKRKRRHPSVTVGKPTGGYRKISTQQICAVWSAYRSGRLTAFLDVRVYWAVHELTERRARASALRHSPWKLDRCSLLLDIRRLLGTGSAQRIRASLRRLQRVGVVEITDTEMRFCDPREVNADAHEANEMLERIDHRAEVRERSIAMPRRTLRSLARNGRPALCATMLAHLIRCLWRNGDRFFATGSCSVAFVANLFDVHERNVKRARSALRDLGWLRALSSEVRSVNAHGAWAMINLAWKEPEKEVEFPRAERVNAESPPLKIICDTKSPPAIDKHNLPSGSKNHNPASGGPAGVRKRTENPGKPVLQKVVPDDLQNASRLDALFTQAVGKQFVRDTPADRLRFFAAAEHAQRIGNKNPCGLFVAVVRRGLWSFVSQADEDRAMNRLKGLDAAKERANGGVPERGMINSLDANVRCRGNTQRDFVMGLVAELATLRSFDSMGREARNGPTRNDPIGAAA